jgi:hypothetical protein
MQTTTDISPAAADNIFNPTKRTIWAGRIISGIPVLFLLFDALGKFIKPAPVVEGTLQLGYPESAMLPIGVILLACTILYIIPRTAVFGAVLLTGYLGGAVATHLRVGNPVFTHMLFPVYVGFMLWLGLYLRDRRVRALLPLREGQ